MCHTFCTFIPPHMMNHIARTSATDSRDPSPAQRTALVSQQIREERQAAPLDLGVLAAVAAKADREIYDDQNTWNFDVSLARSEGGPPHADQGVNQAYDGAGATSEFFRQILNREGADGAGVNINCNVNFGVAFNNAFWDGTRLVFGNGDEVIFTDFTKDLDVIAHEFTHGVTQYTANLVYHSQSGALNEAMSDALASAVQQHAMNQDAGDANWLIGDGVMSEGLYGEAIRSMASPGTAYDNPILGKDPQPDHMDDYYSGPADNQGVHINSGIINKAFYLTALDLGTPGAAQIWYAALQNLWPLAVFTDFATVAAAQARILARDQVVERQAPQTVRAAFREVGVI